MKHQFKTKKRAKSGSFIAVLNKVVTTIVGLFVLFFMLSNQNANASVGEDIYNKMCMSCHSTTDKVLVGPGLKGLSERRTEEWILKWVKNPQGVIDSGDKDAVELFNKFNKMPMPGFPQLKDDEIKGLIAFFDEKSKETPVVTTTGESNTSVELVAVSTDSKSTSSGISGKLLFWTCALLVVIVALLYRFKSRTFTYMNNQGYHEKAHAIPNFIGTFLTYILIAAGALFIIIYLLNDPESVASKIAFIALPYVAISIFVIGSIYRYKNRGYQVSSLSTQFLEGKKLFWGSQPFHWGLMVLFLGHLVAFLFPSAILAWNGEPLRLLILEISSFAFGLSALFGLIMLIKRRLSSKLILVVTNKMDIVVYTILLTQIISGLGVAFFVRWGSSWFSSVLTPYLRSVFSFSPDIDAVSSMPILIQLHIISAFLIIAIIPFTRFMHFLVAPIDYAWRKYQLVVWNWDRSAIRTSIRHNFGKKPRNH
jgi:nitrate reductase gamma subunit